ncbi:IQ domain-containing protein G [Stylophora pistillata]|uniref:Dynein regulatory complex protein 9 n=1 Tax=Stylophora pistillata TaxID=50429 RepID=A0A2B4RR05_STYPI|nr:IQ domain-containing protein G [Stylophora pistillata]
MLSSLDTIHISAVLEDCIDQLAILGHIMPPSLEGKQDAAQIVDDELGQILRDQRDLESRYEVLVNQRDDPNSNNRGLLKVQDLQAHSVAKSLRENTNALNRSFKQNPLTNDSLSKIQADRKFLQDVMEETLEEIVTRKSFDSLVRAVNKEKEKKAGLQQTILKEEESRKLVKTLQRQLLEVKKEKESEIQVRVSCTQKRCQQGENSLKEDLETLHYKIDEEARVNSEIETYLRQHHQTDRHRQTDTDRQTQTDRHRQTDTDRQTQTDRHRQTDTDRQTQTDRHRQTDTDRQTQTDRHRQTDTDRQTQTDRHRQTDNLYISTIILEEKVEYWMDKYDRDVEQKQHELDVLKASKANDLAKLQELTQKYSEYEKVVIEDRVAKEQARRKAEQELEELKSAVKIQSWWRGTMVRKQLGPYSKKKKKKGKKGKKSGKKGGKKKKK